jgi:hypothetical protein
MTDDYIEVKLGYGEFIVRKSAVTKLGKDKLARLNGMDPETTIIVPLESEDWEDEQD